MKSKPVQIIILFGATCIAFWTLLAVPSWRTPWDPCVLACIASVVAVAFLWRALAAGLYGIRAEKRFLAGFLAGMPAVYVARYLFISKGHGAGRDLPVELLGLLVFGALAVLGLWWSEWVLVAGIAGHGIGWDSWHYRHSGYIPDWYSIACFLVDVSLAVYVAVRVDSYREAKARLRRNP